MKRLVLLTVLFVGIMALYANAGCVVVEVGAPMYIRWDDIVISDRIQVLGSEAQYMDRMRKDIERGAAIWVEEGTPVKILREIPPNGLLIEVKGVPLFSYKGYINCD